MEVFFRSLATRIVNPMPHQLIDVLLFGSDEEARMPDENGIPAHEMEDIWHIACGIISIYTPSMRFTKAGMGLHSEMSTNLPPPDLPSRTFSRFGPLNLARSGARSMQVRRELSDRRHLAAPRIRPRDRSVFRRRSYGSRHPYHITRNLRAAR